MCSSIYLIRNLPTVPIIATSQGNLFYFLWLQYINYLSEFGQCLAAEPSFTKASTHMHKFTGKLLIPSHVGGTESAARHVGVP